MSTDLMTYVNYMSTWDTETDENINKLITEQQLFVGLGDFQSDPIVDKVFDTLVNVAKEVRDATIAEDIMQVGADASAIAAIFSFGAGMAAFAEFEAGVLVEKAIISSKSKELTQKMQSVDADIAGSIAPNVITYIDHYKTNNNLIASKAPTGLDTRRCRSILMQFMAQIERSTAGNLDAVLFRQWAELARKLFDSPLIDSIYDALDDLTMSDRTDEDLQKFFGFLKGWSFPYEGAVSMVRDVAIFIIGAKLNIPKAKIKDNAEKVGFEVEELNASSFEMLDAVGKFVGVVAVVMSVVDIIFEILDIVEVVKQCKFMWEQLEGPIKDSYKAFFNGIRTSSQQYVKAISMAQVEKGRLPN